VRFAVVGHVEWVDFLRLSHVPLPGEIVEAEKSWEEAAGGGAVAAVQLAKLAGASTFFTAIGDDERARLSMAQLERQGVEVVGAPRTRPQRRAVAFLDAAGERTIAVLGERLVPAANDALPWDRLAEMDGVYFTGGDVEALRAARAARKLVATPRARGALAGSHVTLDAMVRSGGDESEQVDPERLGWSARLIVTTRGARGGTYSTSDGTSGSFDAAPLGGPVADAYGAGDSFAAALTFALGRGLEVEVALALAARCGAGVLSRPGPYAGQLSAADL
jgi:ribokinase